LEWYSLRWKIETFHKIMKSGRRAEESKLRTAERSRESVGRALYRELANLLDDDDETCGA
jgi:hypothetical protein